MPPADEVPGGISWSAILAFFLLVATILAAGALFYQSQEQQLKGQVTDELTTIAVLKTDLIEQWRAERLHDAVQIAANTYFSEEIPAYLNSRSPEADAKMRSRLAGITSSGQYTDICLVDSRSVVVMCLSNRTDQSSPVTRSRISEAFGSGNAVMTDLYRSDHDKRPRMDVIAPLMVRDGSGADAAGALVMTIDPESHLYPLVQSWPVPSETAETLLVEREGDHVLFLNTLRHQNGTALNLTIPLAETEVPAVMAVLGTTGAFTGLDYRGIEVLSVLEPVQDSPWYIVSKVDTSEAYAPWRSRSGLIVFLIAGTLAGAVILAGIFWQRRQKHHYQELYTAEAAQRRADEALRQNRQLLADMERVGSVGGWQIDTLTNRLVWTEEVYRIHEVDPSFEPDAETGIQFYTPESQPIIREAVKQAIEYGEPFDLDLEILTAKGNRRAVHTIGRFDPKKHRVFGFFQDITARKEAEKALLLKTTDLEAAYEEITATEEELRANYEEIARTQKALLESERKYRNLYEYALVGLFETSLKDGTVIACNKRYADLAGFDSVEDARGKDVLNLYVNPQDRLEIGRILRENRHIDDREILLRNQKTGQEFWAQFSARFDENRQAAEGTIIDITEQKLAEESLRASEQKFRETLKLLDEGYYSCTLEGIVLEHNMAFNRILGFDAERDQKGLSLPDFWRNPDERKVYLAHLQEDGYVRNFPVNARTATGDPVTFLASAHLVRDDAGRPLRIDGTFMDITSLRLTETALRDVEEFNRLLIESSPTYYVAIGMDGRVIMMNRALLEALEYTLDEVRGKDYLSTFVPVSDRENLARIFTEITREGRSNINVNRIVSKSNKVFMVEWHGRPVKQGGGKPDFFVGVGIDITMRLKAEESITRMNEVLTQQTRTLSILNRIISIANSAGSQEELFRDVLDNTLELMEFDAGGIYIIDPATGTASVAHSRNLPEEFLDQVRTVSIHSPRYDALFNEGKPIISNNYEQISPEFAQKTGFRSVVSVPLYSGDRISGSLNVISKKRHVITDDETATLLSVARELGNTIRKMAAEEALRKSETRFRTLVEQLPVGIAMTRRDAGGETIIYYNRTFTEITGYTLETTPSLAVWATQVYPDPAFRQKMMGLIAEMYAEASQNITSQPRSTLVTCRDGTVKEVEFRYTDLSVFGFWTLNDITDRRRAEEEIRSAKAFLDMVIDMSPFSMWICNHEGTVTRVNRALCQAIHLAPDDIIGKYNVLKDKNLEEQGVMPAVRAVFSDHAPARFSIPWKAADAGDVDFAGARDMFIDVSLFPILDAGGDLTNVVCQWVDITERMRAEEDLRASEEKYRDLFENITAAFALHEIILDGDNKPVDYRFLMVNEAFEKMTGLSGAEIVNRTVREVLPGTEPYWIETYGRVALQGNPERYENFSHELGRWFDVRVYCPKKGQFATIFSDITAEKDLQLQQEKFIQELEQKNAELERFTFTVSHDLKSPLITIRGFAGMIESDAQAGDTVQLNHDIQRIVAAAETMQNLLADLLELSRVGKIANPTETVPFSTLAREAVDLLEGSLAEKNVRVEIARDMPDVVVDRARIREVLINLIENAIKFMGNQEQPVIRIGFRGGREKPVFFVQDNGIGINPRYLERIFNLFERLDVTRFGTGIGLPITRRIIEFHGGKIWAESSGEGKGTTFLFTLPGLAGAGSLEGPGHAD